MKALTRLVVLDFRFQVMLLREIAALPLWSVDNLSIVGVVIVFGILAWRKAR